MAIDYKQQLRERGYCIVSLSPQYHFKSDTLMAKNLIVAFCSNGYVDYEFNMERVHLEAGMRVCYTHVTQLRILGHSDDFFVKALVLDYDFSFACTEGIDTRLIQSMFDNPLMPMDNEPVHNVVSLMLNLLEKYAVMPHDMYNRQVAMGMVRNLLIVLAENCSAHDGKQMSYTQTDTYFRRFINCVSDNVRKEHEVVYYAGILCITPKYLSEICKQKTGRTAKEIISALLLRAIKTELLMTSKSMKVLADEFAFANQSSLGKFFRKMTGLSPLHFRQFENSK